MTKHGTSDRRLPQTQQQMWQVTINPGVELPQDQERAQHLIKARVVWTITPGQTVRMSVLLLVSVSHKNAGMSVPALSVSQ